MVKEELDAAVAARRELGEEMDPAVMLSWGDIWIYLLANLAGGAAAAYAFLYTQPGEKITGDVRAAEPGSDVPSGGTAAAPS